MSIALFKPHQHGSIVLFTPGFSEVRVARSLVVYIVICHFSFGNCIVCCSVIYGF